MQKLKRGERHPQALILCPTRELCAQVARDFRKLGRRETGLAVVILSGGQPMKPQLEALQRGVHVVVGTPGRALDHITRGSLELKGVATIVVDEADRMLEMGFGAEMEKILTTAPKPRQTIFFSATYPRSIDAMTETHQRRSRAPDRRRIGRPAGLSCASWPTPWTTGVTTLASARCWRSCEASPPGKSAILFCNFKATVARIEQALPRRGSAAPACTATWNSGSATS